MVNSIVAEELLGLSNAEVENGNESSNISIVLSTEIVGSRVACCTIEVGVSGLVS